MGENYVLQTDKSLKHQIYKYGCYFLCLLQPAQILNKKILSVSEINELYDHCVEKGFMTDSCYILYPVPVINFGFAYYENSLYKCEDSTISRPDEYECVANHRSSTFITIKGITLYNNEHFVTPEWNPYGPRAVLKEIVSMRFYHFTGITRRERKLLGGV